MHIYDKQWEIMQKNQWKGPNSQLQCFYKGTSVTSGALSWKQMFTRKTKKIGQVLFFGTPPIFDDGAVFSDSLKFDGLQGVFCDCRPPKKLEYGKPRFG